MTDSRSRCRQGLCCILPTKLNRKGLWLLVTASSQTVTAKRVQESPKPLKIKYHVTSGAVHRRGSAGAAETPREAKRQNFNVGLVNLSVAQLEGRRKGWNTWWWWW